MLRKTGWLVVTVALVAVAALTGTAESVALEDLHLVHWEQIPGGRPSYTGPVSAAVLMAWYAQHGYPELLPDLSGDGRVDEQDTILLARDFAQEMGANLVPDRLADPFVVYPLARYVAERYPDAFRLLIYDVSFPEEVERELGQPFVPTEVPGIVLDVMEDPSYELYVHYLDAWQPGIVGIGFDGPDWNQFAVSRSYGSAASPEGRPVDLMNSGFDPFGPQPVWETLMRFEPDRWGFLMPEWTPFEILIVLQPEGDAAGIPGLPDDSGQPNGNPEDQPGGTPSTGPGDEPSGTPSTGPGDEPGSPGGDQPRYPGQPYGDPENPPGFREVGACCLPDGSCQTMAFDDCAARGGTFTIGLPCGEANCPGSAGSCAAVEGEITDICYTYERGILSVYASYAIHNRSALMAHDITAYALVGLNDGVNGLGGGPECQDWQYGLDIPGNSTYTFDHVFSTSAPNLDLDNLSYLYGSLWLQVEAPWQCWPIIEQAFVRTWDPAPLCDRLDGGGEPEEPGEPEPSPEPEPEPGPGALPNLWVTDMTGCWSWSNDAQEHVIATVTGVVHNGGQADASNVRARVSAGGESTTVTVGSIPAGGQRTVSATLDLGEYHTVSWPVPTSITADPLNQIAEADESNNTTNSSFPQSSDCN